MMRMLITSLIATAALVVLESPQTVHAQNAAPTAMSAEQAREENAYAIGLQAYLWGFPLHYYSRSTPKSVEVGGSYINEFRKYPELKTAKDKFVVTPNNVTIDAYGTFDVTAESLAAQKGMTWDQALAMSGIVFAGASQMVSIEIWREVWSVPALLEIMAVTAFVNARMILMSASLQPWLKHASGARQALMLFLLTDANWLLGTRYRAEGGRDLGIYLGSGLILWVVWVAATLPGYLAGALVPEPRRFGLDLLMPLFFSAMLVPLWKGLRPALPWAVAGCVALTAHALAPGYVFIMAGALAGALTGALVSDE